MKPFKPPLLSAGVLSLLLSTASVRVLLADDKSWSDAAQLSYLSANGNTNSTTFGASNLFKRSWGRWGLELPASFLSAASEGQRTAEQYDAGEKIRYNINERNYAFENFRWDRDVFAGIAHRYDTSLGLGREWIKTDRDNFLAELGGGYINEQLVNGEPRNEFASGRVYAKYARKLSETANASQDVEYLHNFRNSDDARVNTETALISSLSTHLSLKVSYRWKYRNRPPLGFGKRDALTSVALVVNY